MFYVPRRELRPEPGSGVAVIALTGESIDSLVRRFRKVVDRSQLLADYRRRQYYTPKSERLRIKRILAQKRRKP